jgi:hypothetical protein
MARGFESKSVTDQQESALEGRVSRTPPATEPARRKLELAVADVQHRLDAASDPRMKDMLNRALQDLEKALASIPHPQP